MNEPPTRQRAVATALVASTEAMHTNGGVTPMIIAHAGDRLMSFDLSACMDSPVGKDVAARLVGKEMRRRAVDVYVFMSEAWWAAPLPPGDPLHPLAPSERADRVEALVLHASDRQGDTLEVYRTVRDRAGRFDRFELLESTELDPAASVEGPFGGLLREPTVH